MNVVQIQKSTETLREHLVPTLRPTDLARAAGVSRQYVYDVLQGHRSPSRKLLVAAAELGIPVDVPPPQDEAA
jgi:transcriptional regulator with XRE-family HTH domain